MTLLCIIISKDVFFVASDLILPTTQQTLFWGEYEFQTIANLLPAETLEHVWPTSGALGFEMNSCFNCLIAGAAKLVAISFTVAGGYRGGFIFRKYIHGRGLDNWGIDNFADTCLFCSAFFASGGALGRAISFIFPTIPVQITTLCMAAGINVAITRTSLATTMILCFLAGEQSCMSAVLAASLTSLFVTGYMPFIKSQIVRSDIDSSLYYNEGTPSVRNLSSVIDA